MYTNANSRTFSTYYVQYEFLEVSILQKYSTNKYIGQMPGYRDSKKLCIITNGQGDTA